MYRVGDIRRKNRRRLKRRIVAAVVIAGILSISYLLVFRNGMFFRPDGTPDTIVAVDTLKDDLAANSKKADTVVPVLPQQQNIQKDTPVIPVFVEVTKEKPSVVKTPDDKPVAIADKKTPREPRPATENEQEKESAPSTGTGYKVISVAYFYNEPDESTRRKAYINHWNNSYATLKPSDEKNGFVYVVFKNHLGQISRGWLRKRDLREAESVAQK